LAAGADLIGDDKLIKEIGEGTLNFDKIISTPEHMQALKTMARVLGPKGLMPNLKSGTLVKADDLLEAVKSSKQGLIEFRVNEGATIMNKFGKRDFSNENLETNLDALLKSIAHKRPDSVKGRYMQRALVKTSMGPTLKLDLTPYQAIGASGQ
jgi:large subunit ribosomal protein L1